MALSTVQTGQALSNAAAAAAPKTVAQAPVTRTNGIPNTPTPTNQPTATSSFPVVTSAPATANYNAIQNDYTNNIQPNIQNSSANSQANSNLPVIDGYNVSPTATGNQGETKVQQNGLTYYITPQQPAATASDIAGLLSSGDLSQTNQNNGTNGGTTTGNPVTTGTAGSTTGSTTPLTASQSAENSTGINPNTETSNYISSLNANTDAISQAASTFASTVQSIMSGSFPLSSAQQALVDATNQAFNQMTSQEQLKAAALSSETGGVSNKINATAGEMLNANSIQAASIAKLEIGFENQDYQAVDDAYKAYQDAETAKTTALTDAHNAVMTQYNQAVTDAQNAQNEIDKQNAAAQTAKMDAQTIQDEQDTQKINQADLNLKTATFNATYGAFLNADGSTNTSTSVQNIPGYTPLSNGMAVIDSSKIPAEVKVSQVGGVQILSPADISTLSDVSSVQGQLQKVQAEYYQMKSAPDQGATVTSPLQTQYVNDVAALNTSLKTLATKYPQFSGLTSYSVPSNVGGFGDKGASNFTAIQNSINTGIKGVNANLVPPPYGQIFTDPASAQTYLNSTGQSSAYATAYQQASSLAGGTPTSGQVLQILNGQ